MRHIIFMLGTLFLGSSLSTAAEQPGTAKPLDLSIDSELLAEDQPATAPSQPVLSEHERQLAEQLKGTPDNPAQQVTGNDDESLKIGGGLMSNAATEPSADLLQSASDQLNGIDGAKVDLDLKF